MPLLPGGEHGSRPFQIAYAVVAIWLGWQGFLNFHRWYAISGNLATLANEINVSDEPTFRKHLLQVLDQNSAEVRSEDLQVLHDEAANRYVVLVKTAWTLDFGVWELRVPTVRSTWITRHPYIP